MDSDQLPSTETHDDDGPRLDRRIGPYKLLKELGHGGMGVVYLAARADDQYHKRVALKVIKAGLDREEVIRHFRRERQILASLEHPNIARFLDGGTTDDGLPYFVMEHVEGLPITDYCDRRRLSTLERLGLFRSVCSAIEYAHRNLIVHRDIKPGNILVTSEGTPKLLDFGIAKLTNPGLTGQTATATGLAMTPEYASPEQARGETVATTSDVYSLGVVLYELLTGHLPYRLKTRNPLDVLKAVCEEEPEKPSTAVGRTTEDVGRTREGTADRLRRRLRGDLDTILLKAIQKEPSQRYPSVEALSEDMRRYVDGLPIKARKPTLGYRTRKFVARHWVGVAGATVAALLVLGFSASTYVQSARARKERDKAERVSAFLVDLFKVSDPSEARGNSVTAREILDKGAEKIHGELREEPEVRASLFGTIGNVYYSLGLYEKAQGLLEEALEARRQVFGKEDLAVATSLSDLAIVHRDRGDYRTAEALQREALAIRRKLLGKEHTVVATAMNNLANVLVTEGDSAGAEALYREALAIRRKLLGNEHPDVAKITNNLAIILDDRGDYEEAGALYREALAVKRRALGNEHPDVANTMNNLATLLAQEGDYVAAEALHRQVLAMRRKLFGSEHPRIADSLGNLAVVLRDTGDHAQAEALAREALAMKRKLLGDEHPDIGEVMSMLASVLLAKGDPAEAETLYRQALALGRKLAGDQHPYVAGSLSGLGLALTARGDAPQAEPLLREALRIRSAALPEDHPDLAETESALGACLVAQRRFDEAEPLLTRSYSRIKAKRTDRSRATRDALARIVALYEAWGRPEKAREHAALPARPEDATRAAAAPGPSRAPGR